LLVSWRRKGSQKGSDMPETITPRVAPPPDPPVGPAPDQPPGQFGPPADPPAGPAPAPTSPSAPTPAEPPAAPTPQPAPTPAGEQPSVPYPVEPVTPQRVHAASTTWNGERVDMTQEELDRLAHVGFSYLSQQQQQQIQPQPQQPQPAPTPAGQPQPMGEQPSQFDAGVLQRVSLLEQGQQAQNTSIYSQRLESETAKLNQAVDTEMGKHRVFTDNPELHAMSRQNIMATLNHNPRLSEAQAAKQIANDMGAAINRQKENWISGKVSDARSAEVPAGGQPAGTPVRQSLNGADLMRGRVAQQAMERTSGRNLIT